MRRRLDDVEQEREAVSRTIGYALSAGRLALNKTEAAEALGVSLDFFDQYIAPELRSVTRGRRRLFPLAELIYWLWRAAESPDVRQHDDPGG